MKHQDEMVSLVRELVSLESPSHSAELQQPVFAVLERELHALGYRCRRVSGNTTGGQLLAIPEQRAQNQPVQVLLGHCDTVWPVGTLNRMPVCQVEGRLHGPGTYDMKAGVVQGIFALRTLKTLELHPEVSPIFFINSDEEIGSFESQPNLRRLAHVVDRALVLEPSLGELGKIKTARKGVGRFEIKTIGRSAHAGLDPEKGISAIVEMADVIQFLQGLNDPANGTTVNVGTVQGGTQGNVIAETCEILVDVRVITREAGQAVTEAIAKLTPSHPDARIEVSGSIRRPPLARTTRNQELWRRAQQAAKHLNIEIDDAMAGGGSDGNWMSQHTATLDGLGAVGDGAHALHEHVVVSKMPDRAALLACLLMSPPMSTHQ